ncbi:MAG: cytosine permease [Candidatus Methanomethyliales bacterium]|nr:cytosine permease [Candidatus Methanomethylicales archaeon]
MSSSGISPELFPTKPEQRIVGTVGYTLMILSMTITTSIFFLGWISQVLGLSLAQTMVAALIGNGVVAAVMYLNGYVGVKEGIPFPIQLRTAFGTKGSILPMVVRMIVSLFWYGIDGFIAAWAMTEMALIVAGWPADRIISEGLAYTPITFVLYLIAVAAIGTGKIKSIKWIDSIAGPLLFIFFAWFVIYMTGIPEFSGKVIPIWEGGAPWFGSEFFWATAIQTAWWGTIALNVSDICRYNKSVKSLPVGHVVGLIIPQIVGSAIGFTATYLAGGNLSPIDIIAKYSPMPALGALGLFFAFLATSTTNLTGDIPATTNAVIRVFRLSWNKALIIATIIAFFIGPWWYVQNSIGMAYQLLNFNWYYSMFLGPIAGVMVVDYWVVRKKRIIVEELYKEQGIYYYRGGVLWAGVGSFILGIVGEYIASLFQGGFYYAFGIPLPGLELAWYYGFIISGVIYYIWATVNKSEVLVENKLHQ